MRASWGLWWLKVVVLLMVAEWVSPWGRSPVLAVDLRVKRGWSDSQRLQMWLWRLVAGRWEHIRRICAHHKLVDLWRMCLISQVLQRSWRAVCHLGAVVHLIIFLLDTLDIVTRGHHLLFGISAWANQGSLRAYSHILVGCSRVSPRLFRVFTRGVWIIQIWALTPRTRPLLLVLLSLQKLIGIGALTGKAGASRSTIQSVLLGSGRKAKVRLLARNVAGVDNSWRDLHVDNVRGILGRFCPLRSAHHLRWDSSVPRCTALGWLDNELVLCWIGTNWALNLVEHGRLIVLASFWLIWLAERGTHLSITWKVVIPLLLLHLARI